ncbi:MAG: OmpA family protein [Candidatus Eisenbacteria bacterium]
MAENDLMPEQGAETEGECEARAIPAEEPEAGAPEWVVTFGDMMSLLLCFFVLIVSFSSMDVVKYRSLVGSMREAFGAVPASSYRLVPGQVSSVRLGDGLEGAESLTDDELEHELTAAVEKEGATGEAEMQWTDQGLVLTLRNHLLFDSGSADLRPEALPVLGRVAEVCRRFPRRVHVEGHTDNLPPGGRYSSNWELSAARSGTVVRHLLEVGHIPPERFIASGYAATDPVASNLTPEGRAENRRVRFIFARAAGTG